MFSEYCCGFAVGAFPCPLPFLVSLEPPRQEMALLFLLNRE